jgi:hypothetical protein
MTTSHIAHITPRNYKKLVNAIAELHENCLYLLLIELHCCAFFYIKQLATNMGEDADSDQGATSTEVSRFNGELLLFDTLINRHLDASARLYHPLF